MPSSGKYKIRFAYQSQSLAHKKKPVPCARTGFENIQFYLDDSAERRSILENRRLHTPFLQEFWRIKHNFFIRLITAHLCAIQAYIACCCAIFCNSPKWSKCSGVILSKRNATISHSFSFKHILSQEFLTRIFLIAG